MRILHSNHGRTLESINRPKSYLKKGGEFSMEWKRVQPSDE